MTGDKSVALEGALQNAQALGSERDKSSDRNKASKFAEAQHTYCT